MAVDFADGEVGVHGVGDDGWVGVGFGVVGGIGGEGGWGVRGLGGWGGGVCRVVVVAAAVN